MVTNRWSNCDLWWLIKHMINNEISNFAYQFPLQFNYLTIAIVRSPFIYTKTKQCNPHSKKHLPKHPLIKRWLIHFSFFVVVFLHFLLGLSTKIRLYEWVNGLSKSNFRVIVQGSNQDLSKICWFKWNR